MDPSAGGIARAISLTNPVLTLNGAVSDVATVDNPNSKFLEQSEDRVLALGPGKFGWGYSRRLTLKLAEIIKSYDIVVVEGIWQFSAWIAHRTCKKNNIPYVVFVHGGLDPWFQQSKSRWLKAIRNICYWKLLLKTVINESEALLFTCKEEKDLAIGTFKQYCPKLEIVVGLGTSEPPAYEATMRRALESSLKGRFNKEHSYFLFMGRIHPKKGITDLLEAYCDLLADVSDNSGSIPDLVIAGPYDDGGYFRECQRISESFPRAAGKIFFPGMLTGRAKWGALYGCDAFILPSYQENFGIAVAEALACGVPVLISKQVNIWQEICESGAGFSEPAGVKGAYAMLSKWISLSETSKTNTRVQSRLCFETFFSIDHSANSLKSTLEDISASYSHRSIS